jgi:hypothetical protein
MALIKVILEERLFLLKFNAAIPPKSLDASNNSKYEK